MTAPGLDPSTFSPDALRKVPAHMSRNPLVSFDLKARLGQPLLDWLQYTHDKVGMPELGRITHRIPAYVLSALTKDELCKVHHSTMMMMDSEVEDLFKKDPFYQLYFKIRNCMWRWGVGRSGWNEIVDVYRSLLRFDIGHPDFEVRLDYTTGCNECGYSQHSRTFLDGVFGFLVHYRGEHVMTLGFSVMAGHRLLVQQVQLKNRRGNRWLYKLPEKYLEHVLDRFQAAFPAHKLHLVDGAQVLEKNIASYRAALMHAEERDTRAKKAIVTCAPEEEHHYRRVMERAGEEASELRERIDHAERDMERLGTFYAQSGRFGRGRPLVVNRQTHYEMQDALRIDKDRDRRSDAVENSEPQEEMSSEPIGFAM